MRLAEEDTTLRRNGAVAERSFSQKLDFFLYSEKDEVSYPSTHRSTAQMFKCTTRKPNEIFSLEKLFVYS